MRHIPDNERHDNLVECLKAFLNAQSAAPAQIRYCSQCGSVLHYLPTQFWMEGGENGWNIPLPYCADCHPLPVVKETFVA
jgi:hypothetical protein